MSKEERDKRAQRYFYRMQFAQIILVGLAAVFTWYAYELVALPVDVPSVMYFGVHAALAAVLLGVLMNQSIGRATAAILLFGSFGFAAHYLTAASGLESAAAPLCLYGAWLLNGPKKLMREIAPADGIRFRFRRKAPQGAQA